MALADWMADKNNPFFAKALVNRYWKHFFGRGLVDPEDDMRETNPATNPELLNALAKNFIEGGFDLKQLVRTFFDGSTEQTVAALLDLSASRLSDAELDRLSQLIDQTRKEGR